MLGKSKLNSIASKISGVLINNTISPEDFTTIINEERNYGELTEHNAMMKSQGNDTEKKIWLRKVKEKELMKVWEKMYTYKTIISCCLKCIKNTENINPRVSKKIVIVK